jgi:hypothetical protein
MIAYHHEFSLTQTMNLNNKICQPFTYTLSGSQDKLTGREVIPEAMLPSKQLSASSENTNPSLPALYNSVKNISVLCKHKVFLVYNIKRCGEWRYGYTHS